MPPRASAASKGNSLFHCYSEPDYELIALATRENFLVTFATGNQLRAGQVLPGLPRNTNKSAVVTVSRR
jgi:hypothetical protein